MFYAFIAIILLVVFGLLTYPLWRKTDSPIPMGPEAARRQELIDLEIEKQTLLTSLADLELDLSQGRLLQADYQRLRAVDEFRLGKMLQKLDTVSSVPIPPVFSSKPSGKGSAGPAMPWARTAILGLVVLGSSGFIYQSLQGRIGLEAKKQVGMQAPSDGPPSGAPNPLEMVARLEKRLAANPNDLEGQIMAGRSYMALKRFEDANRAWSKVVEMDFGNYEAHFYIGMILLQTLSPDDRAGYEKALQHFETALVKVPRDPVILWYKGVALVHLKRYGPADQSWTESFQNLNPGSEDAEFVKKALQNLRAGNPPLF